MLHLFSYFVSMCVCLCVCVCMCLCMGNKHVLWTGKIKCDKILLMIVKFDDFFVTFSCRNSKSDLSFNNLVQ